MTNIETVKKPKIIQDIETMINIVKKYFGENKPLLAKILLSTVPDQIPEEEFNDMLKLIKLSCAKDTDKTISKQVQTAMIFMRGDCCEMSQIWYNNLKKWEFYYVIKANNHGMFRSIS